MKGFWLRYMPGGRPVAEKLSFSPPTLSVALNWMSRPWPTVVVFTLGVRLMTATAPVVFQAMVAMPLEPVESVAVTVVLVAPPLVGLPEMRPVVLPIVRPAGSPLVVQVKVFNEVTQWVAVRWRPMLTLG